MATASSPRALAPSTKEQLVVTAERLFALHGLDGVSLRQIGQAAGMGNNSAVQYHFKSRDGLVQAIFHHRVPQIIARRRILSALVQPGDLRSVVEAQLLPMVELAEAEDSYYLTFLAQLQRYGVERHPFGEMPESLRASHRAFVTEARKLLPDLPEPLRTVRIQQAATICMHASADRERSLHHGARVLPYALHVGELFDGLIGFLEAEVTPATLEALASIDPLPTALLERTLVP